MRGAAAVALAVAVTVPAAAHQATHDYESLLGAPEPAAVTKGVEVRMLDQDSQVELVNRSGRTVVVLGYEGEPYARVAPDGTVSVNVRAPSAPESNDRWGHTVAKGTEDAAAAPRWVRTGGDGVLRWFDKRTHHRGYGPPPEVVDRARRTKIRDYRIPIIVGGEPAVIPGTLYWRGDPPFPALTAISWLAAGGTAALLVAVMLGRRRWARPGS